MSDLPASSVLSHEAPTAFWAEPIVARQYQDFGDLPAVMMRKGVDEEGNPWSPDLLLIDGGAVDARDPGAWARRNFAGPSFQRDLSTAPFALEGFAGSDPAPFWVLRLENLKSRRKLLTIRLFAAPAGNEDEALAWVPIDKFLFEVEAKEKAAVARRADLARLWEHWQHRAYFRQLELPMCQADAQAAPTWIFVAALITDAEIDHPENVCHCGSVQACNATAEGLDRRNPRYPFDKVYKHSIRTTFPLLGPSAMRMFSLGK
jgi:hypothetical protein